MITNSFCGSRSVRGVSLDSALFGFGDSGTLPGLSVRSTTGAGLSCSMSRGMTVCFVGLSLGVTITRY